MTALSVVVHAGQKFGRLIVLETTWGGRSKAPCVCDCGAPRQVFVENLRRGLSRSCGCLKRELSRERLRGNDNGRESAIHGYTGSPTHNSWSAMVRRCADPNRHNWRYYGERGITVCDRWLEPNGRGFRNFLADMGERPEGKTLDRIDVDGNYEPGNCRWATHGEQMRNRRQGSGS